MTRDQQVPESMQLCNSVVCHHQQPRHVFLLRLLQHKLTHGPEHLCQQCTPLAYYHSISTYYTHTHTRFTALFLGIPR